MEKPCVIHGVGWIYKEQENTREIFPMPRLNGFVYKELLAKPGPLYPCLFVPKKNWLRSPHRPISATEDGDQSPRMPY